MIRLHRTVFTFIALLALSCVSVAAPSKAHQAPAAQPAPVVESIALTVQDLDRSLGFYRDVLGFHQVGAIDERSGDAWEHVYGVFGARVRVATLQLGDERLQLQQFLAPTGRPIPADSRSNDRWFQHVALIVSDMERAYAWLREHGVAHASTGPQMLPAWNPNAGGIAAFYFRDPDQHHLEILHFPASKGDPKWQRSEGALFLGIDHTAIVVADTDASLRFYRDTLGLTLAGASENHGPEQERLNNVFGARLRITALRGRAGPGVELLEYLAPRTGREMPVDTLANDLWHWQVNVRTDVAAADSAVRTGHYSYVSPGPVSLPDAAALMVRDPDGHALQLTGDR
jgi:catechol 2,3-dioxygenase-like lactoylglutathione lyase family enzyme